MVHTMKHLDKCFSLLFKKYPKTSDASSSVPWQGFLNIQTKFTNERVEVATIIESAYSMYWVVRHGTKYILKIHSFVHLHYHTLADTVCCTFMWRHKNVCSNRNYENTTIQIWCICNTTQPTYSPLQRWSETTPNTRLFYILHCENNSNMTTAPAAALQMRAFVVHLLTIHTCRLILLLAVHGFHRIIMQLLQWFHNCLVSARSHCLDMFALVIPDVDKDVVQSAADTPNHQCICTLHHLKNRT